MAIPEKIRSSVNEEKLKIARKWLILHTCILLVLQADQFRQKSFELWELIIYLVAIFLIIICLFASCYRIQMLIPGLFLLHLRYIVSLILSKRFLDGSDPVMNFNRFFVLFTAIIMNDMVISQVFLRSLKSFYMIQAVIFGVCLIDKSYGFTDSKEKMTIIGSYTICVLFAYIPFI